MDRRKFLKLSVVSVSCWALAPVLSGCGGAAAAPVSVYLIEFATAVGAQIVGSSFQEWLSNLKKDDQRYVENKTEIMVENGFVNYNTPVYRYGNINFYGAQNVDGFNTCAPFFSSQGVPLVEGPALMGIALAGKNWTSNKASAGDGLIPLKAYQDDGSQFEKSSSKPFVYKTNAGSLAMTYTANHPKKKHGLVSVVAKQDNGGLLHGENYEISWA